MRKDVAGVAALAAAALLLRVPSLRSPLSDDEGGFLVVAAQWRPGTSLYGDYWVDRPPLLIAVFELADRLGGAVALRAIGGLAVVAAVLLAARLGRLVAPRARHAPVLAAAVAAIFLSTPLFSAGLVKGELLAVPPVLLGTVALLSGLAAPTPASAARWWLLAGAAGAVAVGLKQSTVDVFLAAVMAAVVLARLGRWRRAGLLLGCVAAAGLAVTAASVAWAASRGTDPVALWHAVVTFRADAAAVISEAAPTVNDGRAAGLVLAFAGSGALGLLVATSRGRRTSEPDAADPPAFRAITLTVVVWELVAVALGGSYWLHYLVATVPGLVLLAAVAARERTRLRLLVGVVAYGAAATVLANVATAVPAGVTSPSAEDEVAVAAYLRESARPGDTGVVAFGSPWILREAGLESPYPLLWSLPVRVLDPGLVRFERLLRSGDRPTWVVVEGESVDSWGLEPAGADRVLGRRYQLEHVVGDWRVYRAGKR
ncbi:hypothetical protein HNR19_001129 [Nocardioides thalensis]|uniref:Glycosyltransferase RgtA/B/C/D-like domain-containing protein n=1 Tax=Nocardioides thalensis TaxID=1914755 RepID=A0A853BZQ0_9ACTN|nr:hypothetical protein [Nocardioides thalensis]NYJ00431.1 hypothetical protein [Nocardioides thalensis]